MPRIHKRSENGMIEKEKVIMALGRCRGTYSNVGCVGCNYQNEFLEMKDCIRHMNTDALALLKDQEPRVMTLEEVKAFGWDFCYLEEERLPGKEYRSICGDYALTCITWSCVTSMRIQHGDDSYGKKWRCWSAKPTDEQRKAVKWE